MKTILKLENISKSFLNNKRTLICPKEYTRALQNIDLEIFEGETFGLVGESGCGKSTLGNVILRLKKEDSGKIYFDGTDITNLSGEELRIFRKNIQMIFQDTKSALNPYHTIGWILQEPLIAHGIDSESERLNIIAELLPKVALDKSYLARYPLSLSGGEAQRIGIAAALLLDPKLIIADEPVSSLDVSIQAEVLNCFVDLKRDLNTTIIFITHNLSVCHYISDRIGVMYFGHLIEVGNADAIYYNPKHPYTKLLLSSSLNLNREMSPNDREEFDKFKSDVIAGVSLPDFVEIEEGHIVRLPNSII